MVGGPGIDDVLAAAARIAPWVHRTPVLTSATLDRELGARVFFKAENLQKVGAFKARGACNAVLSLGEEAARRGVITHSSGNHAAALAYAAGIRGVPCVVVIPEGAPAVKIAAVRGYGAEIVRCAQTEREETCRRVQDERGMTFVHPFEDPAVIAGQGTAALELLEDVPDLDMLVCPVGGGGLASGTAIVRAARRPTADLVLAEPLAVDDAARSLATGVRQPRVPDPDTIADGLLTALGETPFAILRAAGARVVTVTEDAIRDAVLFFHQRMKTVVEPSAATVLAALRTLPPELRPHRIGTLLTGGNT